MSIKTYEGPSEIQFDGATLVAIDAPTINAQAAIDVVRFSCPYDGMDVDSVIASDGIDGTVDERVAGAVAFIGGDASLAPAWRELVLNAIVHCDYDADCARVRVIAWPDAVSISNHHRLRSRTTVDALRLGAAPSICVNPELQAQTRHMRSFGLAGAISLLQTVTGLRVDVDTRWNMFRVLARLPKTE